MTPKEQLKSTIFNIFRTAREQHLTCHELNSLLARQVFSTKLFTEASSETQAYLSSYTDALYDIHWEFTTWVFCYNSLLYPSFSSMPPEARDFHLSTPRSWGFHVYKENTRKHFTGSPEHYKVGVATD